MTVLSRVLPVIGLSIAALVHPPSAGAEPVDPGTWPVAEGNFTTPGDPGWVFFLPSGFDGRGCGIGPDGTVGCDIVPSRAADGTPVQAGVPGPPGSYSCGTNYCPLPPPGADQIVAGPLQRADYDQSGSLTFTREVGTLDPGYRVLNGAGWCYVGAGSPRSVVCRSGDHGFSVQAVGVRFW